jgi:hypothetical protein
LALSRSLNLSIIGKCCLKSFFPEAVKDIKLNSTFLPKDDKVRLLQLKTQIDQLTKNSTDFPSSIRTG